MRYVATVNVPGYLPMDDDPPVFDSARDAWEYLAEELERGELRWVPDDPADPDGPQSSTKTALDLEEMARQDSWGTVYGPSCLESDCDCHQHDLGLAYCVTVVEEDADAAV